LGELQFDQDKFGQISEEIYNQVIELCRNDTQPGITINDVQVKICSCFKVMLALVRQLSCNNHRATLSTVQEESLQI
jgi:hypothetical protein